YNQSPNTAHTTFNLVRIYRPTIAMTSIPGFDNTKSLDIQVNTTYKDGFDNPIMSLTRNGTIQDIVEVFDLRRSKTQINYLPYPDTSHSKFHHTAFTRQKDYYSTQFSKENANAYSKTKTYSNNGVPTVESYVPGRAFMGDQRGTITTSNINNTNEVPVITYSSGAVCRTGYYSAGEINVTKTEGQHGSVSYTYTDKTNRLILKK